MRNCYILLNLASPSMCEQYLPIGVKKPTTSQLLIHNNKKSENIWAKQDQTLDEMWQLSYFGIVDFQSFFLLCFMLLKYI